MLLQHYKGNASNMSKLLSTLTLVIKGRRIFVSNNSAQKKKKINRETETQTEREERGGGGRDEKEKETERVIKYV